MSAQTGNEARRVAVVTGGLGGLGVAICQALARRGDRVIAVDLGDAAHRIEAFETALAGHDAEFRALDVTDFEACGRFAAEVETSHGRIDILVNAAGITRDTTLRKMDAAQWEAVTTLVITVVASTAISFFFYSRGKAAHLQARMAQAQRDATEARLKLLEAQLEPHMMFNTLANLRVLIATDPPRAQAMLDHLIAYLRATLGGARATLHPLVDEFARLTDYLELMAVRMGPRLGYTLELPDTLREVPVPPLLLQPLVENAIRHGLEPQVKGGHITVRASTRPGDDGGTLLVRS